MLIGWGVQKAQTEKDSFSLQKDNFSSPERATLAIQKDSFSTPIEPPLQYKRASLHSKCYRLELKEALFVCFQDIRQISKPI